MTIIVNELNDIISAEAITLPIDARLAEQFAQNLVIKLRHYYGGIPLYIPKGKPDLSSRNKKICDKFNGKNMREVCREFDLCAQQVRKIIKSERK